jgi:hypothetical protein
MSASFVCDLRSLALFRLLLASAVIVEGFTYDGLFPQLLVLPAVTLLAGYRSSWSAIACWLLVAIMQIVDPKHAIDADSLLVALLLLSVFLPIGARYSVDSALDLAHEPGAPTSLAAWHSSPQHVSTATVALTILVLLAVVLTAALSLSTFAAQPYSMRALNLFALAVPVPILLPVFGGWLRFVMLATLVTALIVATGQLGFDARLITVIAALGALLPTCLWNRLAATVNIAEREKLRIYFDRDCGFCRKTCYLFRSFFVLGDATIRPAQSNEETFDIMQREESWVVYDYNGKPYTRWHAVLLLLRRSPLLRPLGWLLTALGMGYWGDPIYRAIGASRWWLSKLTRVVLPYRRERVPAGRMVTLLVGAWLIGSLAVTTLPSQTLPRSQVVNTVVHMLALDQRRSVGWW